MIIWPAGVQEVYQPGECIHDADPTDGTGRYPDLHATEPDGGGYGSAFLDAMWSAYRGPFCYDGVCEGEETAATCSYDCGG